jgi:NAD(P)-dependent dehydrogenase (short-subunit alcohol dehydrogenase family)
LVEQKIMTNSRLVTPFTAKSTAAEVVAGIDLTGRRAIVTGGASGIGIETARALAGAGAEVTVAVRNLEAGKRTAEDIAATTGNARVHAAPLDLADRASVASFVAVWEGPLHIVVNNAGVMASPEMRTSEGWEMQFATNHFGHFALAVGLHRALAAAGGARVVSVSSGAHLLSPVVFDDIHFRVRTYEPWPAYGQSKTANVLFAVEATKQWADDGIAVNALMPGAIRSNLQRHLDAVELERMEARMNKSTDFEWKTPEQGAATSVLLAASPLLDGVGGHYFEDCNEAEPNRPGSRRGVATYALEPEAAARLWQVSLDMLAS